MRQATLLLLPPLCGLRGGGLGPALLPRLGLLHGRLGLALVLPVALVLLDPGGCGRGFCLAIDGLREKIERREG